MPLLKEIKMEQFLAIIKMVAQLYPVLMQIIKSIEDAMPDPGQGPAKLALVKATLENAYNTMGDAKVKFESVWPTLQMVVGAMVATFNAAGVFKKK
jgi:hypothetical protein